MADFHHSEELGWPSAGQSLALRDPMQIRSWVLAALISLGFLTSSLVWAQARTGSWCNNKWDSNGLTQKSMPKFESELIDARKSPLVSDADKFVHEGYAYLSCLHGSSQSVDRNTLAELSRTSTDPLRRADETPTGLHPAISKFGRILTPMEIYRKGKDQVTSEVLFLLLENGDDEILKTHLEKLPREKINEVATQLIEKSRSNRERRVKVAHLLSDLWSEINEKNKVEVGCALRSVLLGSATDEKREDRLAKVGAIEKLQCKEDDRVGLSEKRLIDDYQETFSRECRPIDVHKMLSVTDPTPERRIVLGKFARNSLDQNYNALEAQNNILSRLRKAFSINLSSPLADHPSAKLNLQKEISNCQAVIEMLANSSTFHHQSTSLLNPEQKSALRNFDGMLARAGGRPALASVVMQSFSAGN